VKGKIALEEHFALEQTLDDSRPFVPEPRAGCSTGTRGPPSSWVT
jgi:hypothetical protein